MTAATGTMPKVSKDAAGITPKDLDSARRFIGVIRATSRDPMVFFDKIRKADIVAALTATSWYLDLLPEGMGFNYLAAAAHMAKSTKVKDLSVVASAVKDGDKAKLAKYMDGPLTDDESVCTSSQWRPPIKGRDEAYSAPDLSVISAPVRDRNEGGVEGVEDVGDVEKVDNDGSSGLAPPGGQIPSAQGGSSPPYPGSSPDDTNDVYSSSSSSGINNDGTSSSSNDVPNGKVSDHSSCSTHSLAAPPKQLAKAGVVGGGLVDKGADGSGVAGVGGVGDVGAVKQGAKGGTKRSHATDKKTSKSSDATAGWRPRVCNQVWKGRSCNNMSNGCRFAHPTPCSNNRCKSGPATGCKAFHPRVNKGDLTRRGNGKGSVRRGDAAPKGNNGKSHQPSARRNGASNSNNSNTRPRSSDLRLGERVELMERQLGLREEMGRRLSYRDVAARGLTTPAPNNSNSINSNNSHTNGSRPDGMGPGGFGLAQPSPDMLSAVVAAVMAVLAGKGQRF